VLVNRGHVTHVKYLNATAFEIMICEFFRACHKFYFVVMCHGENVQAHYFVSRLLCTLTQLNNETSKTYFSKNSHFFTLQLIGDSVHRITHLLHYIKLHFILIYLVVETSSYVDACSS